MSLKHILLALLTVVVWGLNFVAIKIGLEQLPPILFTALRFFLVAFPWIFFVRRPAVFGLALLLYAMGNFVLQFAFLFSAMAVGASAGLASLILQVQVFFTLFFAFVLMREKPSRWQLTGLLVSTAGLAVVVVNLEGEMPVAAFFLLIAAAAAWGGGNVAAKYLKNTPSVATLVVWGGAIAVLPLAAASAVLEYEYWNWQTLSGLTMSSILSLLYIVCFATFLGYGLWGYLLQKNPAVTVAQYALLVPVVGFAASALILGEQLYFWKIMAAVLVISGLLISRLR